MIDFDYLARDGGGKQSPAVHARSGDAVIKAIVSKNRVKGGDLWALFGVGGGNVGDFLAFDAVWRPSSAPGEPARGLPKTRVLEPV